MASFYRTAVAVCLVALGVLESEAQQGPATYKFTVVNVDEDAYLSANLARNGKLPVHISEVKKDDSLVTALTEEVTAGAEPAAENCTALITSELKARFHYSFDHEPESEASFDYRQLLQKALEAGLTVFKKAYPKSKEEWQNIWKDDAGASLAYLLASNSTTIGCVIGRCTQVATPAEPEVPELPHDGAGDSGTPEGTLKKEAVLFCDLKPPAVKDSAPFDEEYFNGLIERTTQLKDMTEDDLKNSVGNGPVATASTILIAGLVAMLTAVSA
ncbi:SAG family member [Eimeria mitis]|uniref:SAG family member n=1 Tax=Eimeria mitis TaxID=44415 RepID=U6KJE4_9EIME|nr:SAG family member [Eimeria mitis]CDJ36362.1 SAG family member [Eimeria mitis]